MKNIGTYIDLLKYNTESLTAMHGCTNNNSTNTFCADACNCSDKPGGVPI